MIEGSEIMKLNTAKKDWVIADGDIAYAGNLFCRPIIYLEKREDDNIFEDIYLSWKDYCGEFNEDEYKFSRLYRGCFFPYLSIYYEKGNIYGYTVIKTKKLDNYYNAEKLDISPYLEITRGLFQDEESNIVVVKVEKVGIDRKPSSNFKDYYLSVVFKFSDRIMVGFYQRDDFPLLLLPKREVYVAM